MTLKSKPQQHCSVVCRACHSLALFILKQDHVITRQLGYHLHRGNAYDHSSAWRDESVILSKWKREQCHVTPCWHRHDSQCATSSIDADTRHVCVHVCVFNR